MVEVQGGIDNVNYFFLVFVSLMGHAMDHGDN